MANNALQVSKIRSNDRQCVNEKLPVPWQNKGNDVYHGRPEWIIGQNMPFVPQPSRSCGILGSTNHTQATFWDKFSFLQNSFNTNPTRARHNRANKSKIVSDGTI